MTGKKPGKIKRFIRWLFGSPFEELPEAFGNPVPPELQVFEAEAEEIEHRRYEEPALPSQRRKQTKPVRPDEYLARA